MTSYSLSAFKGHFGSAQRECTPPLGILSRSWGAATSDYLTAIHRPFFINTLVIQGEQDKDPFVIVTLDLGGWTNRGERERLHDAVLSCGVKDGQYLLAKSHTHAGPTTSLNRPPGPDSDIIKHYVDEIYHKIQETIREALANQEPGVFEAGYGYCDLATNRDFPDPQTGEILTGWNPDKQADATLLCGRVTNMQGKTLATVVNYACHPTILAWENIALSPEYIGAMREVVERETTAPCLFLQGASGELAPQHQYVGDPAVADQAGRCLGFATLSLLNRFLKPQSQLDFMGTVKSGAPLAHWKLHARTKYPTQSRFQIVEIKVPLKADLPDTKTLTEQMDAPEIDDVDRVRLKRKWAIRSNLGDHDYYLSRHYLWRLGDIFVVSVPNESYSILQKELRQVVAPYPLFVSTLTNGGLGYLCPPESYETNCYTSWQTPYAQGGLEKTIQILEKELKKLK